MKNHLGSYECKLCLTLHNTEELLAHTQGKRHQQNLARRAFKDARDAPVLPVPAKYVEKRHAIKIGRPGYKVTKSRDATSGQRALLFEVDYPEADSTVQPRHRFMSAYEQRVEPPDKNYQYLLFACEPYETIGLRCRTTPSTRAGPLLHELGRRREEVYFEFAISRTKIAKTTPAPGSGGGKHRADLRYDRGGNKSAQPRRKPRGTGVALWRGDRPPRRLQSCVPVSGAAAPTTARRPGRCRVLRRREGPSRVSYYPPQRHRRDRKLTASRPAAISPSTDKGSAESGALANTKQRCGQGAGAAKNKPPRLSGDARTRPAHEEAARSRARQAATTKGQRCRSGAGELPHAPKMDDELPPSPATASHRRGASCTRPI